MWLGHFIEHLLCIGGELEHHTPLPSPARETEHWSALLAGEGIYRHLIDPGSWREPGLKGGFWSRFRSPTGTSGGGPGARPIGPGSSHRPGPMAHLARPAPWAHEPGPMPPLVPVLD